jgi:ankyrin repeat protein
VRALIELGADVNKARNDGVTPLYIAAQVGHEAVVRALIEAGVDVNRAADDGVTPLYVGAQQGHEAGAGADRGGRGRQQGKK